MTPLPTHSTVLILGANGRFGMAAARAFDAAGWQVLAQVRRDAAAGMPERAELVRAPLDGVAAALAGRSGPASLPSVVVHAVNPIYTRWEAEALPAARAGMGIAESLDARFLLPGNVYNYGETMPAVIDEATPQRPSTSKGRIRAEMEGELERRAGAGRLRSVVITAGDFFGAGSGSWLDLAVVKPIARGRIDYPGDPALMHAWAYLPDLARAFVAIASVPASAPFQRFTFAGHSVTGQAFIDAVETAAAGLGLAPVGGWRHGRLPWPLIRALGLFVSMPRELARMSYLWRVPHALDGRRLEAAVGPLQPTPLGDAMGRALRDLGLGALAPSVAVGRPA